MAPRKKNSSASDIHSMENKVLPLRRPKCVSSLTKPAFLNLEHTLKPGLEELDPNTMDFSQLVDLMHPKFISDYLERILNFLTDTTVELRFPDIAPFKKAFLERLAVQPANLRSSSFDTYSAAFATKILDVLNDDHVQFKWICSYENECDTGVLVYRKKYCPVKNDCKNKHPGSVPPNQLHNTNKSNNKQPIKELEDSSVPTNFKIQWLEKTLKFVKNDQLLILQYPEMTSTSAAFLYTMIHEWKQAVITYGPKSMYAPLWEALKIFSLKYDFVMTSETTMSNLKTLILEKIPKKCVKVKTSQSENVVVKSTPHAISQDESSGSSTSSRSSSQDNKLQIQRPKEFRKLQAMNELVNSLRPQYITDNLNLLVELTEQEYVASIILKSSTLKEQEFLSHLLSLAIDEKKHWIFLQPSDRESLKKICKAYLTAKKMKLWSLSVNWRVVNKEQRQMEMILKKTPTMNGSTQSQNNLNLQISKRKDKSPEKPENPRAKFLKALSVDNSVKEGNNKRTVRSRDPSVDSHKSVNKQKSKEDVKGKKPISFKSAGHINEQSTDQSISHQPMSIDQPVSSNDRLTNVSKAKQKIFEAMSTPIDIDKGVRMMKLMGWSGGALGARGEGITEPIMPAILIKSGAGLGHIPEPPKPAKPKKDAKSKDAKITIINTNPKDLPKQNLSKAQRAKFRGKFLRQFLEYLTSDLSEGRMEFGEMTVKEANFVVNSVQGFNSRKCSGLNTPDEIFYLDKIKKQLKLSQFTFKADIDVSTKSVTITKLIAPLPPKKKAKSPPAPAAAEALQSRRNILEHLAKFVTSDKTETEFHFNTDLYRALKSRLRLENIVAVVNKKATDAVDSVEQRLYEGIFEGLKGGCLSVKTLDEDKNIFLVQKIYRKKFINSSLPTKTEQKPTKVTNNEEETYEVEYEREISRVIIKIEDKEHKPKEIDVEYEKKMFQNEIDHIENGNHNEVNNNDRTDYTDHNSEINNLEQAIRKCDLEGNAINKISETNGHTNISAKRLRTDSCNSTTTDTKKNKANSIKTVIAIVSEKYPNDKITKDVSKEIQNNILTELNASVVLPLLQSHGLHNGALVYSCYNNESSKWLEKIVNNSDLNIKTISCNEDIYKNTKLYDMEMKINTLVKLDVQMILTNLEIYNVGLNTSEWKVREEKINDEFIVFSIVVDEESYDFICAHKCALYAGFDKALFRLQW